MYNVYESHSLAVLQIMHIYGLMRREYPDEIKGSSYPTRLEIIQGLEERTYLERTTEDRDFYITEYKYAIPETEVTIRVRFYFNGNIIITAVHGKDTVFSSRLYEVGEN